MIDVFDLCCLVSDCAVSSHIRICLMIRYQAYDLPCTIPHDQVSAYEICLGVKGALPLILQISYVP